MICPSGMEIEAMKNTTRILLLEDNPIHREILADELRDYGCDVRSAKNLGLAKTILDDFTPDLFLLDIVLAGNKVEVIEMVKSLRGSTKYENTPVVFVTAYHKDIVEMVSGIARSTVLDKPFSFEDLVASVKGLGEMLRGHESQDR